MTNVQTIIEELEEQRAAIESALSALRLLGSAAPKRRGPGRPPKKQRRISEEGKKRIAEAQRQRWAAQKKASKETAVRKTGRKTATARKNAAR